MLHNTHRILRDSVYLALICLIIGPPAMSAEDEPIVTVCEVLKNVSNYRDKVVRITGDLVATSIHGSHLQNNLKEETCPGLRKWPPGIALAGRPESVAGSDRNRDPRRGRLDKTWTEIRAMAPDWRKRHVNAVFIGKLEAREGVRIFTYKERGERGWAGDGYGHSGGFRAQLILDDMIDVWVEYEGIRKRVDVD